MYEFKLAFQTTGLILNESAKIMTELATRSDHAKVQLAIDDRSTTDARADRLQCRSTSGGGRVGF